MVGGGNKRPGREGRVGSGTRLRSSASASSTCRVMEATGRRAERVSSRECRAKRVAQDLSRWWLRKSVAQTRLQSESYVFGAQRGLLCVCLKRHGINKHFAHVAVHELEQLRNHTRFKVLDALGSQEGCHCQCVTRLTWGRGGRALGRRCAHERAARERCVLLRAPSWSRSAEAERGSSPR
jgi:hypothetical protein